MSSDNSALRELSFSEKGQLETSREKNGTTSESQTHEEPMQLHTSEQSLYQMVTGMAGNSDSPIPSTASDTGAVYSPSSTVGGVDGLSCESFTSQVPNPASPQTTLHIKTPVSLGNSARPTCPTTYAALNQRNPVLPARSSSSFTTSPHITSAPYSDDCSNEDNFLMSISSDSSSSQSIKQTSHIQDHFSPLHLNQSNFMSNRTLSDPATGQQKSDNAFSTVTEDQSLDLASDVMFCPPPVQNVPFSSHDLSPTFPSTSCTGAFDSLSRPTAHSPFGNSEEFGTPPLFQAVTTESYTERTPQSSQIEPLPTQFLDDPKTVGVPKAPQKTTNQLSSGGSSDEGGKSDSGLGESDSQQSSINYASLTPWTTKFLTSAHTPSPTDTASESLPMPLRSVDTGSMLAFSAPIKRKTLPRFLSSKHPSGFACLQGKLGPEAKCENPMEKDSRSGHKNSLKAASIKEHRFKRTAEALQNSGLWEVTMRTGNLIKRNRELQKELNQFRGEALNFLKSVIKNPENRSFIQTILSNALANGAQSGVKPSVMSVVVTAASAAAKSAENSPSTSVAPMDLGKADNDLPAELPVESNFLGVETRPKTLAMDMD